MKKALASLILLAAMTTLMAHAIPTSIKLGDNLTLRYGADMRARWEAFDRTVPAPDGTNDNYPPNQYLRVRTRAWIALDLDDNFTFNLRLANRLHKVSSSPSNPNDMDSATWEAPDEIILDQANIVFKNLFDKHLEITLGRQSVHFANGMIFSDTTPFDQGRSTYTDGITFKYTDEVNTLSVFTFYDRWKDHAVFINDQNRRLRSGDVFTAGAYWTRKLNEAFNVDLYYVFNDIDDEHPFAAERFHDADTSASIHTIGARAFGKPVELIDYSLEFAQQLGRDAQNDRIEAHMLDARLNVHLDDYLPAKPVFGLNFTQFSGDKPGTGTNEGWTPLHSQCPLWGDELIPILINGNWTNLNSFRTTLTTTPWEDTKLTFFATKYIADEDGGFARSNNGSDFGTLLGASASYKLNKHVQFLFQISHFKPGDYFANGHDSFWGRFEVTLAF